VIQLLKENIGVNLCDLGSDIGFLDMTQCTNKKEKKSIKIIKIKRLYVSRNLLRKWEDVP
jgi:hypothetical protein